MFLIDNTVVKAPTAWIEVDTPYMKGKAEVICLKDVSGACPADDPDSICGDIVVVVSVE